VEGRERRKIIIIMCIKPRGDVEGDLDESGASSAAFFVLLSLPHSKLQ
jgi:hypothetical protein